MCLCIDVSSEFFNEKENCKIGCLLLLNVSNVIIAASVNHIDVFIGIFSTFFEFQSTIILIKKIVRYHFVILEHLIFFLNYT